MNQYPSANSVVASAAAALKQRVEEVNRLNVFPVPDGDTGTNMSLTIDAVVTDVAKLSSSSPLEDICQAATHGSLMGARGNSGVITSQIIRGACEGLVATQGADAVESLAQAFEGATRVAYKAVRKPVEGTILTVCKDMSVAAREAADGLMTFEQALEHISQAGHASVARTPDLLPVLREAGVVDAGGYGLTILFDAMVAAITGEELVEVSYEMENQGLQVVPIDDWDDDEYLYCTEFLLFGEGVEPEALHDYVAARGGSELVVGDKGEYKVHVHTNDPAEVLAHALSLGDIAEVHVHNMRRQQAERPAAAPVELKARGVVAVASGPGLEQILKSLGVDVVVTGGQTMNPSTADLVEAARKVNAAEIVFLPNNKNIVMAANAAVSVLEVPSIVIPTRSVPEAFAAMLAYDDSEPLDELLAEMTEAYEDVITVEVTTAIKDAKGSKVGDISEGQTMAIVNAADIEAVGGDITSVVLDVLAKVGTDEHETLTILAGEDFTDAQTDMLVTEIRESYEDLEIETHRGDQPLYPIIMSIE